MLGLAFTLLIVLVCIIALLVIADKILTFFFFPKLCRATIEVKELTQKKIIDFEKEFLMAKITIEELSERGFIDRRVVYQELSFLSSSLNEFNSHCYLETRKSWKRYECEAVMDIYNAARSRLDNLRQILSAVQWEGDPIIEITKSATSLTEHNEISRSCVAPNGRFEDRS